MSEPALTPPGAAPGQPVTPVSVPEPGGTTPPAGTPSDRDDDVLGLSEAAALLKIGKQTLRRPALAGAVPGLRIGATWRFSRNALRAALADTNATQPLQARARHRPTTTS